MRPKSMILESLTAAQIQGRGAAPSTTLLEHLARGIRINKEADSGHSTCGQAGFRKELVCLTNTIAQIEQSAKAGDGAARSCSERFVAIRVASENISASDTATHDPDFALQIAKLTKAQILSLTPTSPAHRLHLAEAQRTDVCPREEDVMLSDVGRFLPTTGPTPPPRPPGQVQ